MKTKLLIFVMVIVVVSCKKDDAPTPIPKTIDEPTPKIENRNPGSFTLLEVPDETTDVDLLPTLTWNSATDPDGDMLTYDVFLGIGNVPETKVAGDLTTTTFSVSEKLDMALEYSWQVIAKDGKGGETSSAVFSFKSRNAIVAEVQTTKPFDERFYYTSLVYKDKMWVIGGSSATGLGSDNKNDVWASSNGLEWELMKPNDMEGFSRRRFHASVVHDDGVNGERMYVIGGIDFNNNYLNDVWDSTDGTSWNNLFQLVKYPAVGAHSLASYNERISLLAGIDLVGHRSKIYATEFGTIWAEMEQKKPFYEPRKKHATVVFNERLWMIGGQGGGSSNLREFNDIWQSEDGKDWTLVNQNAEFAPRHSHKIVVHDDKMWLIGGSVNSSESNEIWYSVDGETWIDATPFESLFKPRAGFTSLVYDNKIWILGGSGVHENVWTIE